MQTRTSPSEHLDDPASGNGGTCDGDSAEPNFFETTQIVAARVKPR